MTETLKASQNKTEKVTVLFIENGMSFGGAMVSLSELLKGSNVPITPVVVSFAKRSITKPLFENNHFSLLSLFNYKTKAVFNEWAENRFRLSKIPGIKIISLLEVVNDLINISLVYAIGKWKGAQIVHCNNNISSFCYKVSRLLKVPLVYHFRGPDDFSNLPRSVKQNAECYLSVSKHLADKFSENIGVPRDQFKVLPDPVIRVGNTRHEKKESNYPILIPARIVPFKGQLEFIESIASLLKEDKRIKVWLVGDSADGGNYYLFKLQQLVQKLNLKDQVVFFGYQQNVSSFYTKAFLVANCSLGPEGFGRTIIEGFAHGIPAISTNIGGPKEIIMHGRNGFLYEANDKKGLCSIIRELIDNKSLHSRLSQNAIADSKLYSAESLGEEMYNIYISLLKKNAN
ncbi:glycosyltransferase family 4 protein [Alteromonas facilis]|uniref:glycosyltransferase family 4 protein n=1 Tax=Alteromonas facilis TaxID=2048004 RepID=UPI0013DAF26D|nr:glycosyltransferase family 4 protein [Alteromonas facilis]